MQIVTITSDWSKDDYYSGAVKGKILSTCSDVQVMTLSNHIRSHTISEAAFIVRNSFHHFPEGTVHLIAVNTSGEKEQRLVAAKIAGHYFLSADNGFFDLLGDAEPEAMVAIDRSDASRSTFPALDVLAPAACRLLQGEPLEKLGSPVTGHTRQTPLRATLEDDTITGAVIHIDSYGNAITNITRELFDRIGKERPFEIYVQSKHYRITRLCKIYIDADPGDLVALFNSIDLLEIAIRSGSAAGLLNLSTDSTVRVEFKQNKK
jgi:S-adenosylmethionine hydrolase